MARNSSIMIGQMNELNANIRLAFECKEEDYYAESEDVNENKIILVKGKEQYEELLKGLVEDGTPYVMAVVVGRKKTDAERRAELVLEKARVAREKKNLAQNKRRAKAAAEAKAAKEVVESISGKGAKAGKAIVVETEVDCSES
jgi:hypothetical protein